MKILFINLVFENGSTGKIIADTMDLLQRNGNQVKVLYGVGKKSSNPNAIKISGQLEQRFHNYFSRLTDHAGLYSYYATKQAISEINKFKPDLIHVHTLHGFYINYMMLFEFLKKQNIPIVMTLHDCWTFTGHCTHFSESNCSQWRTQCVDCKLLYQYPKCYLRGDVKNNYLRKKHAFSGISNFTITVPSEWLKNQVDQSFLANYPNVVIPNGVDTNIFYPRLSDLRDKYNLKDKKIILGVASTWNKQKGLSDMVDLSMKLDNNYQVVIIGVSESQIESFPSSILGIRRTADQRELAEWYSIADVFVNPTYQETFGMTTIEAQACGTPVVVYKTGGCPETVESGNGILVEKGNETELLKAVIETVNKNNRANSTLMERFKKEFVYQQYIDLYDSLI